VVLSLIFLKGEENIHYGKSPKEVVEFLEASDFENFLAGIGKNKR
jgi:hypothetical protein